MASGSTSMDAGRKDQSGTEDGGEETVTQPTPTAELTNVEVRKGQPDVCVKSKDAEKPDGGCCTFPSTKWCKRYFWEGQDIKKKLSSEMFSSMSLSRRMFTQYRRLTAFLIPAVFFNFFWWALFIQKDLWHLFPEHYAMTITMIFGSIIAGMTSEGGGAVAFPVMTLALHIHPSVARDFALMIQSCGMTAAAFTIFFMRVRVEWHSLIWCSLGGVGGMIFGLHVVDPALVPAVKKLGFVSIWFAFATVLLILNRTAKRRTFNTIPNFNWWRALVLLAFGFLGGVFSAFSGSGIDICSFMILTLLFRVSEKIATPTSVILMAGNTMVGFYWRAVMLEAVSSEAWQYFAVCIPVVVFGAPIGSVVGTHFHRLVLAGFVIFLDSVALISAFAIIRPLSAVLVGGCIGLIVGCLGLFALLTYIGQKLLEDYERTHVDKQDADDVIGAVDKKAPGSSHDNAAFEGGDHFLTSL